MVPSSYRPVSNLSFLSKVLLKAVLLRLNKHIDSNSLLPAYQSAYRSKYSCETALMKKLVADLFWDMEHQKLTALVAIDLTAAFDTVDHDVLLRVLEQNFGITDNAIKWFDSYLQPRRCKVSVGASYSNNIDLNLSVPQGSCAGPVLYLAHASTLQEVIPDDLCLHGYADDHAIKMGYQACATVETVEA